MISLILAFVGGIVVGGLGGYTFLKSKVQSVVNTIESKVESK